MTLHLLSAEGYAGTALVEEVQGLDGAYSFSEKLLQKIWMRGSFDRTRLVTTDGQAVNVRFPGKWNLLGGPDFMNARLDWGDGRECTGDVELHLHADGWAAHGHAGDRAYDRVVLHVVLFPPPPGHVTRGSQGKSIPVIVLLPLLDHDLEQFAADEAVELLANRPGLLVYDELAPMPADELSALLRARAELRWRQKVHYARVRIQSLGWESACHHAALEILGYRFNRTPMLRIAGARPLSNWTVGAVDVGQLMGETPGWSLQGIRPANHPRVRLLQYRSWVRTHADWPSRLVAMAADLPEGEGQESTRSLREARALGELREKFGSEICGGALGGTRLDNMICDGFLPLLAARNAQEFLGLWYHWYPGDLPPSLNTLLRALGAIGAKVQPANHGLAQGLLGWMIERERLCAEKPAVAPNFGQRSKPNVQR